MRSTDKTSGSLFGDVGLEAHIPDRRPLRVKPLPWQTLSIR